MSTRQTLWFSDEYHLFIDGFDNENVYLEIKDSNFQELVLKIPLVAWKQMRKHTIQPDERYLELTDEELRTEAKRALDEHIADLAKEPDSPWKGFFGSFVFGPPDTDREDMIENFLRHYGRGRVKDQGIEA